MDTTAPGGKLVWGNISQARTVFVLANNFQEAAIRAIAATWIYQHSKRGELLTPLQLQCLTELIHGVVFT